MIMDGNKRWSDINKVTLKKGYQKGLDKIKEIISICLEKEIEYLTIYALSSENIKRSSVSTIFDIMISQKNKIIKEFSSNNYVRIKIIGEKNNLPIAIKRSLKNIEKITKKNSKLKLNIAFNYGTDKELLSIIKKIIDIERIKEMNIHYDLFKKYMYLGKTPDPDLLIRTGGFQRLSNFMLLNISYTELYFTKTLWPDLSKEELLTIFNKYLKTERKYGL